MNFTRKDNYDYFIYYEKCDGTYRCYNTEKKCLEIIDQLPFSIGTFHMGKGYEPDDDSLMNYHKDFKGWVRELRYNKILSIVYDKYYNHRSAVGNVFKMMSKGKYEHFDNIHIDEHNLWNKCFNGGLANLNMKYINITIKCYGYDFRANYPTILQREDFKIPTTAPVEEILKKLPKRKDIKLGIYRVKITSEHKKARHIFAFSKHHHYTDISLKFAMKHKKQFDFKFELIQDGKTNAYIYNDYVSGSEVFGRWYNELMQLKTKFPKNKLVKHLLSSIWGTITHTNILIRTEKQMIDEKLDMYNKYEVYDLKLKKDREYYELVETKKAYTFNIRIKPFLVAYARNGIAKVIIDNIDTFVRVQTDGACFRKPIDYEKYDGLIPEDKSTGRICWENVNQAEDENGNVIVGRK
jgi:hypothetical protein